MAVKRRFPSKNSFQITFTTESCHTKSNTINLKLLRLNNPMHTKLCLYVLRNCCVLMHAFMFNLWYGIFGISIYKYRVERAQKPLDFS